MAYENVQDHGAVGDGSTDDTSAIQSAIDAVVADRGGTVYFPAGTYLISSALRVVGDDVRLLLDSATVQTASTSVPSAVEAAGFRETDVALGEDAERTNFRVHAPGHDFAAGDWVELVSDDVYQDNVPRHGEQHRVVRAAGDRFDVHDRLYETYRTAANARVRRVNHVRNFTVDGGTLRGSGVGSGPHRGVLVTYGNGVSLRNVRMTNFDWAAAVLQGSVNATVESCVIHDLPSDSQGYALVLEQVAQWVTMANCTVTRCGSTIDNGGLSSEHGAARFVSVVGNAAGEMTRRAFAMHENGFHWTFQGNTASCRLGDGIGFFIRGSHVTLNANKIKFTDGSGISVALRTHENASHVITNNVIEHARANGIHLASTAGQGGYLGRAVIANNVIEKADLRGIYLDLRTAGSSSRLITISGNSVQSGTDGITVRAGDAAVELVAVVGNALLGSGRSRGVRLQGADPGVVRDSTVVGNVLRGYDDAIWLPGTQNVEVSSNAVG